MRPPRTAGPSTARLREDDGWLLAIIYDGAEHRSRLYVLDARNVESDPIAVVRLPHHIPYGFHGTFTKGSRRPLRLE